MFCHSAEEHTVCTLLTSVAMHGGTTTDRAFHSLAAVNFCLFLVGSVQCFRILNYQRSQTGSTSEALKELGGGVEAQAKKLEDKAEDKMT